jgi:predicted dehydrogenase
MPERSGVIRVGLAGYGLGGAAFHAPVIATTAGLQLTAIVTRNPERQARAARDHPGVLVVDRADALLEGRERVDLLVVATPNRTHAPLALEAIDAGIAVVVDKPFAASVADARDVVQRARRRGCPLTVYHNRRWDGDFLTVRRLVREGALGDLWRFESRFERWRPVVRGDWRESAAPEDAGGLLYDLGSHLVDQSLALFGSVTRVYAELGQRRAGTTVPDDVFLALTHASGVQSHLWTSLASAQRGPRFRLLGGRAAYTKFGVDVQEEALRAGVLPGGAGWGEESPDRWGVLGIDGTTVPVPTERGAYPAFYAAVAAALRDGSPVPVDPEDAVTGLRIIAAAQQSSAGHRVVDLTQDA